MALTNHFKKAVNTNITFSHSAYILARRFFTTLVAIVYWNIHKWA